MLFPAFLEKNYSGNKKIKNSFRKKIFFKYWKVPLHLLVKWEVSPNSRYREFEHEVKLKVVDSDNVNLYPIYI